MYHQPHNTFGAKIFNAITYQNYEYDFHFHKSFEILYCLNKSLTVNVDGTELVLNPGEFAVVFPYTRHNFKAYDDAKVWVGVFSGDYIPELEAIAKNNRPKVRKYVFDGATQKYIESVIPGFNFYPGIKQLAFNDEMSVRAALYVFTDVILKNAEMAPISESGDLVMEIIRYIEKNYTEEITLKTAADALGYNYQYLSRVFQKSLNMNFRSLINQYRFDSACKILEKGDITMTRAALDSGFQSVRNFNRIYKEKTGASPSECARMMEHKK